MQKEKILLLNACRFEDKKTKESKCLINYIYTNKEAIVDSEKCYGCFVQTQVIDVGYFNLLKPHLLDTLYMNFETIYKLVSGRSTFEVKGFVDKNGKDISLA